MDWQEHELLLFVASLRGRTVPHGIMHIKGRHGQQAVDAQRLHKAGLSDSNLWQLCVGCEDGDQVSTHLHRFFCPTTRQQVRSLASSWIRDRLDTINGSLSPVEHCALIRGMVAHPTVPTRPDSDHGTIMWHTWQVISAGCSLYTEAL